MKSISCFNSNATNVRSHSPHDQQLMSPQMGFDFYYIDVVIRVKLLLLSLFTIGKGFLNHSGLGGEGGGAFSLA